MVRRILPPSACGGVLSLGRSSGRARSGSNRDLLLLLALRLCRRRIPVVDHLSRENSIEHEASNEPIEDQLVINLLQRCEDSREGASEVVEDLRIKIISIDRRGFEQGLPNLQRKRSTGQFHPPAKQLQSAEAC